MSIHKRMLIGMLLLLFVYVYVEVMLFTIVDLFPRTVIILPSGEPGQNCV